MLTICVVAAAILLHAFIKAGVLEAVNIKNDGIYPGGHFVYKYFEKKDYAISGGLLRIVSEDLKATQSETDNKQESTFNDILYSVLIDNGDTDVGMGDGRLFGGILIDKSQSAYKDALLGLNSIEMKDRDHRELKTAPYEIGDLPSVRSAVAVFPYTGGFVSALLHNYKVYPALIEHAKKFHKEGQKVIISSSCNEEKQLCHHYVPMTKVDSFLLGRPSSEEYKKAITEESLSKGFNLGMVGSTVGKLVGL